MPGTEEKPGKDGSPVKQEHHVLPLVMRMRSSIDQIFSRYVGPISSELSAEEFDRWREEGRVGPSGLHRYISRLAGYIAEDGPRREFIGYASRCIQLLTTKG
jgi:hypothetical protein